MKAISTQKAPAAIGPYSQAIQVGNLVYTSGQLPIDPATGVFAEGGIQEQTRQSLANVKAILEEAGLTMNQVVKTTVFLADMGDFADMNSVYAEFFAEPKGLWWKSKSWPHGQNSPERNGEGNQRHTPLEALGRSPFASSPE